MEKIAVLMSTYNGEKYIVEQLESVLSQKKVEIILYVRDDGSSDHTIDILKNYKDEGLINLILGNNIGPARSFLELLEAANKEENISYYAFADQDDIWDDDKIYCAISQIKNEKSDIYYSALRLYGNNKKINGKIKKCLPLSAKEMMLRNPAAGCTMVFKKNIADMVVSYKPNWIEMHDSWIMRVAICTNHIISYSSESHLKYRIHDNNTCGVSLGRINNIKSSLRSFFYGTNNSSRTADELIKGYNEHIENVEYKNYLEWLRNVNESTIFRIRYYKYINKSDFCSLKNYLKFIVKLVLKKI